MTPESTIETFESAWNSMDFETLKGLWAREDHLYYVAEETPTPMRSLAEIEHYYAHTAKTVEWVKLQLANHHFKSLADDLVVATFDMHVDASMHGYEQQGFKPVGFDHRVSAILRRTGDGWRFIHYVEAPLGVLPFIRRVYNDNVRS